MKNEENSCQKSDENLKNLKRQLTTAHITIKHFKEKIESNCVARMQLELHIQTLNYQINELLEKIKVSNIQHSESEEKLVALKSTMSTMEQVSF